MAVKAERDGRQRQIKRDQQLRRKLETEIGKRRNQVGQTKLSRKQPKGSVMVLKPLPPLTMKDTTTVLDAAQYMSAKRSDCVLVLDDDGAVSGIFTAKDLAYKVVAAGRDGRNLPISEIMTANPIVAGINTSATDALNMMVDRGFRHLPVIDDDGEIAGVLDITKCFHEAMQKLERAYESSRKLHDALEGVHSELGGNQPAQIMQYVQALKERTSGPDLASVLDGKPPVFVDVRANVKDVTALMKENRTTAVLVTDQDAVTGIFTSKDVVLRVLAAGINPSKCSVIRVMTPNPDSASSATSIQDALRKMHEGHFLNLPVMDEAEETVIGVVDVLRLTYATLEQIGSMASNEADSSSGPAWNRFWMSLDDDDTSSIASDSQAPSQLEQSSATDISASELAQFSFADNGSDAGFPRPGTAEIGPEDSLSRMGLRSADDALPSTFAFKFKSPGARVHRIMVDPTGGIEPFRQAIVSKLTAEELRQLGGVGQVIDEHVASGFAVSYLDSDGDLVSISTSHDVEDAVKTALRLNKDRTEVHVHHTDGQPVIEKPVDWLPFAIGGIAVAAIAVFVLRPGRSGR